MIELTRILYVEDDPFIRELALVGLEMGPGLVVCACETGSEALERAPGFAPQLALLDVVLPDLDGPTTLARLRSLPGLEGLRAVFMTGETQAVEIERLALLGRADVIGKPFDPITLAERLRAIWRGDPA